MVVGIRLLFIVAALVLFILAGLGVPEPPYFRFVAWGLAFWVASTIIVTH